MKSKLIGILVVAVVAASAGAASADTAAVFDPGPDAEHGGQGRLNLKAGRHGHDGRIVTHSLRFYGSWRSPLLAPVNETELSFVFITHTSDCSICPDPETDVWHGFHIRVVWKDGRLRPLITENHDRAPLRRSIEITRRNRYSISVSFPARAFSHDSYTWNAHTIDPLCGGGGDGASWSGCSDVLDESLQHHL